MAVIGRPTKFTAATRKIIIDAIAGGNTRKTAAGLADVHVAQLYEWVANGRAKPPVSKAFADFSDDIKRAEARAIADRVKLIKVAGKKSWTAAAWWLERRYPEDWSLKADDIAVLRRMVEGLEKTIKERASAGEGIDNSEPAAPADGEGAAPIQDRHD